MIWLVLAAVGVGGGALAWGLAGRDPLIIAGAALVVWAGARAALAGYQRIRGSRPDRASGGPEGDGAGGRRSAAAAAGSAVALRAPELDAARDPATVARIAVEIAADAAPGCSIELWLATDRGTWRRPQGTEVRDVPGVPEVQPHVASHQGAVRIAELAGQGGGALAALAAAAPGAWVAPLVRADRLIGLLFGDAPTGGADAGGADAIGEVLAAMRPAIEEALGQARLVRRVDHARELAGEVELAAAVQQAFIPDGAPRVVGPIELAGSYVPASQCGGDWWAVHDMGDARSLLLVADVTGHGIGAARITAAARGAHDVAVHLAGGAPELGPLMSALDAAVRRVGAGHYHMTCFAAVIDPDRRVSFTAAGHVPPYLCRAPAQPGGRAGIDALVARGNPLGVSKALSVKLSEQTLQRGDLLLFYSDGLIDCTSPREERLGDRRMQRLLRDLAAQDLEIGAVRDRIEEVVREHAAGSPQDDDITFIAARVL